MESLYRLRREEEREAQRLVARLRGELAGLEVNLADNRNKRANWIQTYNEIGNNYKDGEQVLLIEQYLISLEKQEQKINDDIKETQYKINLAVKEWEKAYRLRRQVEYIKEKQLQQYHVDLNHHFQKEMDQFATMQFGKGGEK